MPLNQKPTRHPKTEQRYRKRARSLAAKCRKDLSVAAGDVLDYRRFTGWLITRKPELSRVTWRQYKASAVYFLEKEANAGDSVASEALELLLTIDVDGCVKKTLKTSGSKMKKVPAKDFKSLMKAIDQLASPWSEDLRRWIISSMLTGLRPIEWSTARIKTINNEEVLVVDNAKASNGRAHGPTRNIFLGGLNDDERDTIKAHIERTNLWEQAQQYDKIYHGCASTLSRVVRNLWPGRDKYITLYSLRHQFSANAKASGFTREEIAALMGHAVDTTATEHYGRKTAGYDMIRVRPDPKDVAAVRVMFKSKYKSPEPKVKNEIKPPKPMPEFAKNQKS